MVPLPIPVKSYEEGLMPPGCMCVCEVYLPSVHFGWEQISQNPPAAVELVEIVPRSPATQLRKSDQSEVGFNLHEEQGTSPRETANERVSTGEPGLCAVSQLVPSDAELLFSPTKMTADNTHCLPVLCWCFANIILKKVSRWWLYNVLCCWHTKPHGGHDREHL